MSIDPTGGLSGLTGFGSGNLNLDGTLPLGAGLDRLMASNGTLDRFQPETSFHTVQSGETLSGIAKQNGTSWQTLARINGISDPGHIAVGQRLRLPDSAPQPDAAMQIQASGQPQATGTATPVTADQIRQIMPHAGTHADDYAAALNNAMDAHGISTPEQRSAFLAQISVESGQLRNTSENLNYSAGRLQQVWPRRFPDTASALPYAHDPEALGNHVYANRLGNGNEASGDGYLYRGRGLMQVTGREHYRELGFENNPDALSDPQTAADTAAAFWQNNNLNTLSEGTLNRHEFDAISHTVNGGDNGSNERWSAYQRALDSLQAASAHR